MTALPQRLQTIRERLERATPGPWTIARRQIGKMLIVIKDNGPSQTPRTICQFPSQSPTIETQINRQGNSEFIAHSPQDIAFLLQAVEVMDRAIEAKSEAERQAFHRDICEKSMGCHCPTKTFAQQVLTAIERLAVE